MDDQPDNKKPHITTLPPDLENLISKYGTYQHAFARSEVGPDEAHGARINLQQAILAFANGIYEGITKLTAA